MTLLALREFSAALGGRRVVEDVTLGIGPGELVGLIGPNGAGKSTLLRAALGLTPSTGESSLLAMTAAERARHAAWLPQGREIAWDVTVETVVGLGRAPHTAARPWCAEDTRAVRAAMADADIADLGGRVARALSGGEQARVLLARALAQETPLLLADEPTAALDPAHQIACMAGFARLAGTGRAAVVALHDLTLAARWCSRLVLMDRGRVVADGAPEAVLTPERLRAVYGIEAAVERRHGRLLVLPLGLAETEPA